MKITKLKRGYRVTLSDGEFDALDHLVALGMADVAGDELNQTVNLSPGGRRAIISGRFSMLAAMHVDEDRRGS